MKQILNDPTKLQEEMALVRRNLAALQNAEKSMRNPQKRQQVPWRGRALDWHVWEVTWSRDASSRSLLLCTAVPLDVLSVPR